MKRKLWLIDYNDPSRLRVVDIVDDEQQTNKPFTKSIARVGLLLRVTLQIVLAERVLINRPFRRRINDPAK